VDLLVGLQTRTARLWQEPLVRAMQEAQVVGTTDRVEAVVVRVVQVAMVSLVEERAVLVWHIRSQGQVFFMPVEVRVVRTSIQLLA
jgi:hypothetical protein